MGPVLGTEETKLNGASSSLKDQQSIEGDGQTRKSWN